MIIARASARTRRDVDPGLTLRDHHLADDGRLDV
jgi:hypothetical protein